MIQEEPLPKVIQLEACSVQIRLEAKVLSIMVEPFNFTNKLKGEFTYQSLPIEFKIIFESIDQFHLFILEHSKQGIKVKENQLIIIVTVLGKVKEFHLPLVKQELTAQQILEKQLKDITIQLEEEEKMMNGLINSIAQKDAMIEEKSSVINTLEQMIYETGIENERIKKKIKSLDHIIDQHNLEKSKKDQKNKNNEDYQPYKKQKKCTNEVSEFKQLKETPFVWDLDYEELSGKALKITNKVFQKLKGVSVKVKDKRALNCQQSMYFDVKILSSKTVIAIGVLSTATSMQSQPAEKEDKYVYLHTQQGVVRQDGSATKIESLKLKKDQVLRTIIGKGQIQWHLLTKNSNNEMSKKIIGKETIISPFSIFFQLCAEGSIVQIE